MQTRFVFFQVFCVFTFLAAFLVADFSLPLGLPPIPWPEDNPYTKEKAELGKLLYFDKRLSSNQTVSCASCHSAPFGYSDGRPIAVGIDEQLGSRHSPTIINAAYDRYFFWDGRASSLEDQCKGPIGNTREMTTIRNNERAHERCVANVCAINGYLPLFKQAFDGEKISLNTIVKAIATFERTIVSGNSPYDRYMAGDKSALSKKQIEGMQVFEEAHCSKCHSGFNFTDNGFANIGIGMDSKNPDVGRYAVTGLSKEWGAFKTPSLREVAKTPPYMHDGSLKSLQEVIDYYDKGGVPNAHLNPLIRPLHLTKEQKEALCVFLEALSGQGWQAIKPPEVFPN